MMDADAELAASAQLAESSDRTAPGGWWSRRVVWVGVLVVLCVGAGGAWVVAGSSQSPEQAAARADEPAASWVTASVELRVLSATVIQRGDVAAEAEVSVVAPSSVQAPAVVTKPPPVVGAEVVEGDLVVEVSGRPVFVFGGSAPMYRSLRPGMSGDDVAQLQAALGRLGYSPDGDGVFGEATKTAVEGWYREAGYEPVAAFESAEADLAAAEQAVDAAAVAVGDANAALARARQGPSALEAAQVQASVDQASRAVDAARAQGASDVALAQATYDAAVAERDRLAADPVAPPAELSAAELQVGQAGAQLDAARRSSAEMVTSAEEALALAVLARDALHAPAEVSALRQAVDAAVAAKAQADAALAAAIAQNGPTVPLGEAIFLPQLPARVRAVPLGSSSGPAPVDGGGEAGGGGGSGSLVDLAGGGLVVTTAVRPGDVGLVRVGMAVTLLDETTSTEYSATITSLAEDAVTGADGPLGHPAVITPDEPLPDQLVGANLRVTITAASTESEALVVPLAAVSSAADGSTRVSVVGSVNDPEPVDVEVEAGLSADGFVAIVPTRADELEVGDLVVVGQ